MTAFVTGALGQLGQELRNFLPADTVWTDVRADEEHKILALDITDAAAVREMIGEVKPDVIYHCAAYTNVDGAESNEATARAVNVNGTANVAQAAQVVGAKLVVISTDYVFDGETSRASREIDKPNPLSVYGRTKLESETVAQKACTKTFIVRTAWLYGPSVTIAPVKNFPLTMKRIASSVSEIKVVDDQFGSPTFTKDLATALLELSGTDDYGIWHVANADKASWHDFASAILNREVQDKLVRVTTIPSVNYPTPAKRPKNSVLDTTKFFERFGPLRSWQAALADYLDRAV